jgi:hypothetical protein
MKLYDALNWLTKPRHLWLAVFVYTIVAGVFVQFVLLPHVFPSWHDGYGLLKGVDGWNFHRVALHLAQAIDQHGWSQWTLEPQGQLVSGIAAIFYVLIYPAPWSVLPINALLNATSCVCLYLLLARLTEDRLVGIIAAAPFMLFPSNFLWNTQFHNENYAVPGVVFILFGWILVSGQNTARRALSAWQTAGAVALIAIGSILLGLVRHYILTAITALFLAAAIALAVVWLLQRIESREYLTRMMIVLAACASMVLVVQVLAEPEESLASSNSTKVGPKETKASKWSRTIWLPSVVDFQLSEIARARRQFVRTSAPGDTGIDLDVAFRNAGDVLAYSPRALQIGFLSPFPSLWFSESEKSAGTAMRAVSAFEMSFVFLALAGLPIFVWQRRRQPAVWVILSVCVGMLAIYAMSVPNVGALYRFRYPYLMPLVCLGLAGWISRTRIGSPDIKGGKIV